MDIDLPEIVIRQDDFFNIDSCDLSGNIFMLLNPPYGIRFSQSSSVVSLYKRIAVQITKIAKQTQINQCNVLGFVLCPTEESWSELVNNLRDFKIETYHFTQGGLDIRVCQFFSLSS